VKYSVQKDHSKCNYRTSPFISIAHQLINCIFSLKNLFFLRTASFQALSKVHSLIDFNFHSIFPWSPAFFSVPGTKLLKEEKKTFSPHTATAQRSP